MAITANIIAVWKDADLDPGFLKPIYTFPKAIVRKRTTTKGWRKKMKAIKIAFKNQKNRVLGKATEASINGHESCNAINSSDTPEKLTRLINKIISAAQTNKPSSRFLTASHERKSAKIGISE
jgi:hypothetical protein